MTQKKVVAYVENDAVGCYDKITNSLMLLFSEKLGILKLILRSLQSTWQHTMHRIKTTYGISEEHYTNCLERFLFGPGQGSTIGPILWLLCLS